MVAVKKRQCSVCKKVFKPMTNKQWEKIKYTHEKTSDKHKHIVEKGGE